MSFSFIASPYSHEDPDVMHSRYLTTMRFCAWAFDYRMVVYSPVVHWHQVSREFNLPTDAGNHYENSIEMIESADDFMVLCIEGWQESRGVLKELLHAARLGKPIKWIKPLDNINWEIDNEL